MTTMTNKKSTGKRYRRTKIYLIIFASGVLAFQLSAFFGAYNALKQLWGIPSWSFFIAFGLIAVDFGSIGKFFSDDFADLMDKTGPMMMIAWVLTALGETYLQYLNFHSAAMVNINHIMITSGRITITGMTEVIPWGIAIFEFLTQTAIVITLDQMVNEFLKGRFK